MNEDDRLMSVQTLLGKLETQMGDILKTCNDPSIAFNSIRRKLMEVFECAEASISDVSKSLENVKMIIFISIGCYSRKREELIMSITKGGKTYISDGVAHLNAWSESKIVFLHKQNLSIWISVKYRPVLLS